LLKQKHANASALDIKKASVEVVEQAAAAVAGASADPSPVKAGLRWRNVGKKVTQQVSVMKAFRGRQEASAIADFN